MNIRQEDRKGSVLAGLTAEVVSAYVSNNGLQASELPGLIAKVHEALGTAASAEAAVAEPDGAPVEELKPAVPIKKSVQNEYLICLECGKPFKALKRHLLSAHGLTPEQYQEKWNLPAGYPLVAPAYAKSRSDLAKKRGFGRKPRSPK